MINAFTAFNSRLVDKRPSAPTPVMFGGMHKLNLHGSDADKYVQRFERIVLGRRPESQLAQRVSRIFHDNHIGSTDTEKTGGILRSVSSWYTQWPPTADSLRVKGRISFPNGDPQEKELIEFFEASENKFTHPKSSYSHTPHKSETKKPDTK